MHRRSKYLYYLRNINWKDFEARAGFDEFEKEHSYDIAISFAGAQREIAKLFYKFLSQQLTVFYDNDHQHEIFGQDTEEFLKPIYETDSHYVLALFSKDYPYKFWPHAEYDALKKDFLTEKFCLFILGMRHPIQPVNSHITSAKARVFGFMLMLRCTPLAVYGVRQAI